MIYCGANIDFVDINLNTYNIDPDLLEQKLREAEMIVRLLKC